MGRETFTRWLNANRPELELVGEYKNLSTKTLLQCKRCGAQMYVFPKNIQKGRHICKCMKNSKWEEKYRLKLADTNPSVSLISVYNGSHSKAVFRCKDCGNTWTQDTSQINRVHCEKCKKREKKEALKRTLKLIRPELKITGRYVDSGTPIQFYCEKCNSKQSLSPNQLVSGAKCPGCKSLEKVAQLNDFLVSNDSDIRAIGDYKKASSPIECICLNNHHFFVDPTTLKNDPFCPICSKRTKISKKWKIKDCEQDFLNWLSSNNIKLRPISPYVDDETSMEFKCESCNKKFSATPNQVKSGYKCPVCEKKAVLDSKASFTTWISSHRKDLMLLGDYADSRHKAQFKCNYCGASWETSPLSIYEGSGCKACANSQTSYMQQVLFLAFQRRLGKSAVKARDKSAIGRELDIYIPEKKFAIEVGAWYWHRNRVDKDLLKIDLCKKAGINLVVIYDQYRLDSPPYEGCITYNSDLRYAQSGRELRELTSELMKLANVDNKPFSDIDWNNIHDTALTQCFRTDDKAFREWLAIHYPSLRMIDNYNGANAVSEFQCRNCGVLMEIKPTYLQQEKYRKKCNSCGVAFTDGNVREAQFESWLASTSSNINIVTGTYKSVRDLTTFHCNNCNMDFMRTPKTIKQGVLDGIIVCPECRRISKEQEFISWLKCNTDGICLNSKYTGSRDPAVFLCSKCGYEWTNTPCHLKERNRCPKCGKK